MTLLEITVLAFATCAIMAYIILWHKPQDIKVPTYIKALAPWRVRQDNGRRRLPLHTRVQSP